jgi:hypothetical protein
MNEAARQIFLKKNTMAPYGRKKHSSGITWVGGMREKISQEKIREKKEWMLTASIFR